MYFHQNLLSITPHDSICVKNEDILQGVSRHFLHTVSISIWKLLQVQPL